ncbi:NB-ARC domain-containing protein [Nostoc sp. ChiQUE01b]|uniref:NB-ARC domain-containing protein n=1 Tax=Nostoc sp. ChiQUE01b TaxID=3075376 RepID=UPI002AD4DEE6|nr:NB-ARC domain-containing protein [Nostoc sp. ChiQUE01b]MDZ8261100.1 NB-ARC domain-containing protein [Nostoc sp. ChiQUE01b]
MSERNWQVYIAHHQEEEDLAEKLAKHIREAGYEVVHRGTVMVGESFTEEVSKILSAGGAVVLCGTSRALGTRWASQIVNAARQQTYGKQTRVFCIQMEQEADVERLSFDECIALYWQNPAKAIEDLIAALKKHYPLNTNIAHSVYRPLQAPPLPAHFVERPEYSDDLKTRLLNGSSSDSRTLVITAIHGLGSVGKSTLAAALAHDAEIQSRFCDGILWATLGQQPNVLALLSGWVQALGDYSFKPTSVEATSSHLRTLLYDKAVLLVVDDAWNTENARAFNFGGARCQVLVTTREGHIADALAASTYSLDIMKPDQAMELLTKKLRREIAGTERHSAENLAKGVGYLPLALELAAAEVACGTTWNEMLADIQQEVARLTSFDRPEAEEITDEASLKRLSLTASLNLSVKRMPPEKQQHFSWLGVLPEDVNINKMMAATLWQMDKRDAARAIQNEYFRADALSTLAEKLPDILPEALAAARGIQDEYSRANALSALADKLPPKLLSEALAAARGIQDEYSRANALSALADKLPPELLPEALAAARAIQDEDYRANVLSALASGLSQMPTAELFSLWQDTPHELSLRTRSNLLQDIKALFPVIFALGGKAATVEIARAIVDVGRWWK